MRKPLAVTLAVCSLSLRGWRTPFSKASHRGRCVLALQSHAPRATERHIRVRQVKRRPYLLHHNLVIRL